MPRILVVGLGNPLMADDGAGIAVAERLGSHPLPPGARAEAGDTDSLRLLSLWRGEAEVWLVDAILAGAPPGTIHRLSHDEVLSIPQRHAAAHFLSLPESLRWIAAARPDMAAVHYRLFGIEPESIALSPGLTPAVARAVVALADEIAAEIGALADAEVDRGAPREESIARRAGTEGWKWRNSEPLSA
jgi:hydrogenase maturation protease